MLSTTRHELSRDCFSQGPQFRSAIYRVLLVDVSARIFEAGLSISISNCLGSILKRVAYFLGVWYSGGKEVFAQPILDTLFSIDNISTTQHPMYIFNSLNQSHLSIV